MPRPDVDVPAAYDRIADKFFADRSTALCEKKGRVVIIARRQA